MVSLEREKVVGIGTSNLLNNRLLRQQSIDSDNGIFQIQYLEKFGHRSDFIRLAIDTHLAQAQTRPGLKCIQGM